MVAIDLNDERARHAGEIGKVRPDGMLTPELRAIHATIPKNLPADPFGAAAIAAQFSGPRRLVLHNPLTQPLLQGGEELERTLETDVSSQEHHVAKWQATCRAAPAGCKSGISSAQRGVPLGQRP